MDMDAPLPDELEWLESNAYPPSEDDDPTPFDESPSRTPKRPQPDDPEVFEEERSAEKRGRTEEEEEEWLRYSPRKDGERMEEVVVVEERLVSRFASEIDGDCVPVTGPDGDRVYVKVETSAVHKGGDGSRMERPSKGLLFEPIDLLMKRVEDEALQKALQESFEPSSNLVDSVAPKASEQLWVEKYAPNSFTELLSDELTNREVLHWLKQWDSCVFGSQIRATTDDVLSSLKRHTSIAQGQHRTFSNTSYFGKTKGSPFNNGRVNRPKFLQKENDTSEEASESCSKSQQSLGPPEHKVLLLCGPPGLGKTTLAHVAAKHCGYRVVEINASDERSSSSVESKILDVVQMNSVMADSKPKCLVIDEIDGALGEGKGAVDVILKMVNAGKKYSQGNNNMAEEGGKPSSRKGHKTAKLSRPVICICNDLYAPALRPLRQIAKVHIFMQPSVSRVVNRLKYICKMENFRTSSIALSALAGYTECDIRSCLNTLQFLNKKNENLKFLEIDSQVVGRKDLTKSAFDVWKEVFQKRKVKRENSRNASSISGDFEFMYSLLSNRGEYELTMDGIYENFLQMSYHDPVMRKTSGCLDVLGVSDSLLRYTMQNQKMSLNVYQPFVAISMKNLIAQVDRPYIEWPKSIQRCRMTLMEKNELLKIWQGRIIPSMSRHMSPKSFVEDIVSPLLHILSPPTLRPVALHLLSEKEKEDLFQLVDTMVSYSVTYRNSKLEHTTKTNKYGAVSDVQLFTLDPPIDDLIGFKDHQPEHHRLPLATKQILVHEVEKHRILCESTRKSLDQNKDGKKHQSTCTGTTTAIDKNSILPENKMTTSSVTRSFPATGIKSKAPLQPKKSMGRPTSFFDRFRVKGSKGSESSDDVFQPATMERDSRPLLFKYNEGFTNAVKRPVRVRELLL